MNGTKFVDEKVCIVIDRANLLIGYAGFGFDHTRLDIDELCDILADGRKVVAKYICDSCHDDDYETINELNRLERNGFTVKIRPFSRANTQKGVDGDIISTIVEGACNDCFDTAIIVSGDCDMLPAVEIAHKYGKRAEVASFKKCASHKLVWASDSFWDIDGLECIDAVELAIVKNVYEQTKKSIQTTLFDFGAIVEAY